ncbi:amino acid ABC transporter, permease/substrate-binding protein [Staphylococcus aureus T35594]|uniref:ABC transporter substrate-binding protein/permease n=1 Tax=Staphylococcus aureus TaxID=1280 RepID=UPI00044E74FD|nr:ABC transporter permease subunit [Staphylococcus aureus]EJX2318139.1 ABC transporter permease subunit [Staphylococcus aureus]EVY76772.1 amino acid ABC transporter, permease/substrate-binding protein [Staphylococcus aureus W20433]EWJ64519.1 amino acid ABC transporter, permease/substrate-binding protein [Staphylococcus aureus F57036]EWJ68043.1 amino acid ABC transporter, permease/substrate-binding protein [Staphylococcus aureus F57033]EWL48288.1 amino acid ABC transporter, permease/substrate-
MKCLIRFILVLGLLISSAMVYINPTAHAEQDQTWEKIKERGELRVGLSADYAPMEFEHTVNGKTEYAGVDIDLAKKITKDNNLKLKIVNMSFDSLLGALKTGKIDIIISGMTSTPERKKQVDFSDSYMMTKNIMLVKKDKVNEYKDIKDFNNKKVGAQKGTEQEKIAQTEIENASITSLSRLPDVILALKSGKVEGAVVEKPVAEAYLKQNPKLGISNVKFNEEEKDTVIAVPKDSPKLLSQINKTIKEVKDKGLIDKYMTNAANAMNDDSGFISKYGSFFLKGIKITILISLIGVALGSILGAFVALMKLSKIKIISWIASIYIEILRGTPMLVQVFIVFFGITAALGLDISALVCGTIALVINSSAYIAEIIRAGINAVDKGQMEAARSLGLNYRQTMKSVIMPQAIKNILPALGNEFVTLIKESSIVSTIGVGEIMFNAQVVQGISFDPFTPLLVAAALYFVLTFVLTRIMNMIEGRLNASD